MENAITDEYEIESSGSDPDDGQEREMVEDIEETASGSEQEMGEDIEETANGSEQDAEPEESERAPDPGGAGTEIILECSCDVSELAACTESLQRDVLQVVSSLDAIRMSCTSVVFLLLFIWAERKIKNVIMKFTGGKKNASID